MLGKRVVQWRPEGRVIERVFIGWERPVLWAAAEALDTHDAAGTRWDMGHMLAVVPGRQAGRRLRQILQARAQERHLRLTPPEIITPTYLFERLFCPPLPLASPTNAHCAWLHAAQALSDEDRALLGPMDAAAFAVARTELMAEAWSFAEAAARCAALPGFCEDRRWDVLARLETHYRAALAQAGLQDQDDARREALGAPQPSQCPQIVLIGTVDLNSLERALLRALTGSITAIIPAPQECQDGFDDVGGLIPEFWHSRPLPIPEDRLRFPETPTAEVHAVAAQIAALRRDLPASDIRVGIGDERAADGLARRLAARGLPTRSPYGLRLSRTRPAVLLLLLRDFLAVPSSLRFAALVRHPDLEPRLTDSDPLLNALDEFLSAHLPEQMPDANSLPPPLGAAWQAVQALLTPLHGTRALHEWAVPLAGLLDTVYPEEPTGEDAEGRQLQRALQGIRDSLEALAGIVPSLAPRLDSQDALTYLLRRLDGPRLPDEFCEAELELRGWLELAWDDAPALLLSGLHEGAVPQGLAADPLLPDTLRRHLGLPDALRRQARDAFLLRVMLESRPETFLFAVRRGADGEPRRPSRLLFLCDGETAARRALRFAEGDDASGADGARDNPVFSFGTERRLPPPRPEPLAAPLTQLRVTGFRDYLRCPYRFYLTHVLKLDEREDSADEMNAAQFGELLHACLAALAPDAAALSSEPEPVQEFLRAQLRRQTRRRFGDEPPAAVRLQIRQAGRRLDAFAVWQARQAAEGWRIQPRWAERDLEAPLWVDTLPFLVTGRIDRIDYHPGEDRYRIMDYKTGDAGAGPDAKHRGKPDADGLRPWTDLQLPLYRLLAAANGIRTDRLEVGYVLLPADLPKTDHALAPWTTDDYDDAHACAQNVIRALRREQFWPPAAPGRSLDALSPLCLDRCRDRVEWFGECFGGESRV